MLESTTNSSLKSSASLEKSRISTGLNIKAPQAVSTLKITKSSLKKAKEKIESIALSSSTVTLPKSQPTSSETGLSIRSSSRLKQTIVSPSSSNLASQKQRVSSIYTSSPATSPTVHKKRSRKRIEEDVEEEEEDDENISPRKRSKFNCSR